MGRSTRTARFLLAGLFSAGTALLIGALAYFLLDKLLARRMNMQGRYRYLLDSPQY